MGLLLTLNQFINLPCTLPHRPKINKIRLHPYSFSIFVWHHWGYQLNVLLYQLFGDIKKNNSHNKKTHSYTHINWVFKKSSDEERLRTYIISLPRHLYSAIAGKVSTDSLSKKIINKIKRWWYKPVCKHPVMLCANFSFINLRLQLHLEVLHHFLNNRHLKVKHPTPNITTVGSINEATHSLVRANKC